MTGEIATVSEKFYAGMTREEAQTKGVVEKNLGQKINSLFHSSRERYATFDDVDLNQEGILQNTEICAERDLESSDKKARKYASAAVGAALMLAGVVATGPAAAAFLLGTGAIFAINGIFANDGSKDKQQTELYRQEHLYKAE